MAGALGLEPRSTVLETVALPLNYSRNDQASSIRQRGVASQVFLFRQDELAAAHPADAMGDVRLARSTRLMAQGAAQIGAGAIIRLAARRDQHRRDIAGIDQDRPGLDSIGFEVVDREGAGAEGH